ncbi:uncharacterized mitochondrial protein-like protein [Tanacetum coccineum]
MPPKHDLSLSGIEEFINEPTFSEPTVKKPVVETSKAKASADKPKIIKKNNGAPTINDWVSDSEEEDVNAVKASACWVWKPKTKVIDHVSKHNSASTIMKRFDYIDAQGRSKYMIGNMSYLTDFEEIDGGYVAFGGNPKGGKIIGRATKDETSGILKSFITGVEHLIDQRVKVISVARTPQQNGVAERKNKTLIEAARIMLADSKLPTTFWAEAVNTACYVQNRVLIIKPHNKTPYELFLGRKPALGFMRPFGRTRIVEENLHVQFSENTPNIAGSGPNWLFDIDALTKSMNYKPVVAGNQSNGNAGTKACDDAGKARRETVPGKDYILLPLWPADPLHSQNSKSSPDAGFKPLRDNKKKVTEEPRKEGGDPSNKNDSVNNTNNINTASDGNITNNVNTVSSTINTAGIEVNVVSSNTSIKLPNDPNMPKLEDFVYLDDYEDVGAEADMNNLNTFMPVGPIPTTRIHKDHPVEQIIGDLNSAPQTRRMTKNLKEHEEPKKVIHALKDPSWTEAMQDELLQFKLQKVWTLVDLPNGKKAISTKWVFKNKKDERGIVIKNKARLVAQGYTQEEGINYDEFFASVARIEAIRLFLAYASFKDFVVYRIESMCDFIMVRLKRSLYDIIFGSTNKSLCIEFEKMMHKKFLMSSMGELIFCLGLQVKQKEDGFFISQDKYVTEILNKFGFTDVKTASTLWKLKLCSRMKMVRTYTDSDYAGASLDWKSTIGGCQFLGCRLISWQCKKQTVVANSTTEAEYVAASSCCGQVLWIQNQLLDYGYNFMHTNIYIDNESTICIVKNPVFLSKIKHIEIRHHFIKDSNEKKLIQMIKIHTDKNVADLLTKAFDFWSTVKAKTVNGEVQLQAQVDGKKIVLLKHRVTPLFPTMVVQAQEEIGEGLAMPTDPHHTPIITQPSSSQPQRTQKSRRSKEVDIKIPQSSVPSDPINIADEAVNEEPSMQLKELMDFYTKLQQRVLDLENTKTAQDQEITSLKKRVKKLEKKGGSRTHKLKRLYMVGRSRRVVSSKEESLGDQEDASKQGRIDDIDADKDIYLVNVHRDEDMFGVNDLKGDEIVVESEVADKDVNLSVDKVTLAQALAALKSEKVQEKRDVIKEPSVPVSAASTKLKKIKKKSLLGKKLKKLKKLTYLGMIFKLKLKLIINWLKDYMDTELVNESFKKAEVETAQESSSKEERKKLLEQKALRWATRADGKSQMYLTFIKMLKNIDREDLEVLWSIVKARFKKTEPVNYMDIFLPLNLKTMFEHHLEDGNILYYMLVEKMYPLTKYTLHQMFNDVKLQVDYECEMAFELLRLVKKQFKEGYVPQ